MSDTDRIEQAAQRADGAPHGGNGPEDGIPGKPRSRSPSVAEPTEPTQPWPPKPDQSGPATVSPTRWRS